MLEAARGALYPVLPLRDIVVFPHMIVPLFVGREKSVRALEDVMKDDKQILLESMFELPSLVGVSEIVVNREVVEGRAKPLHIYSDRRGDVGADD